MALTPQEIYEGIREGIGDPPTPILTILNRLYGVANSLIGGYLKDDVAPEDVRDQAAINVVAYLYNTDPAGSRNVYANALVQSGAASLLDYFRVPRALLVGGDSPSQTSGLTPEQLALLAQIPALVDRLNRIRAVPGAGEKGQVLGRIGDNPGEYGWTGIAEDQIDAAIRQFIEDNPDIFTGVTASQLEGVKDALEALIATERARIDNLTPRVTTNETDISALEIKVSSNTSAIAKNLGDLNTERGRINTINNRLGPLTGSIAITPNTIPNAASVIGNYTFANEDLDVAWLNAQGTNQLDIWFKNTGVHAVRPYSPTADQVIEINVNENEARAIGIGANEKIIPIRAVWRKDGQFVALKNTWLEIRELPTTDAPTQQQFTAEKSLRISGDIFNRTPIADDEDLTNFLTTQLSSNNVGWIEVTGASATATDNNYVRGDNVFFAPKTNAGRFLFNSRAAADAGFGFLYNTVDSNAALNALADGQRDDPHGEWLRVTADFKYAAQNIDYKVDDILFMPPFMSARAGVRRMWNVGGSGETFEFSVDDKIEMLNLRVEPGFILYENGKLTEALTTTVRVIIDNPDRLDETLWFEGEVDGQDVVARTAWTVRTGAINFVIPVATARLIGQNDQLAFDIQFYDAANAGNLVGTRKINVPLEELPTIPPAPRPARQAVNATTANTAINPLLGAVVDLTLTASTTIAIAADFNGSSLFFRVHQPSAGNRTLTLGGNMLDINTGPNTMTYIGIQRIGNSWTVIGIRKPS